MAGFKFVPSYANVTATLALVVGLSGGAYAATLVGTGQLRNGAVTTPKIAVNAVTGAKVANGTLTLADLAPGAVLRNRGPWSSSADYKTNDIVQFGGASYVARRSNKDVATSNTTNWALLAAKGATGATGATGPAGPTQATSAFGSSSVFVPVCSTTKLVSTTVTPTVNSRLYTSVSGYWTPNGSNPAGHSVAIYTLVYQGNTAIGGTTQSMANGVAGVNDTNLISNAGLAMTIPVATYSTPMTLSAGTTYTVSALMDIYGSCANPPNYIATYPQLTALLTADHG